jgi:hypothetical protein
MVSKIFWKHHLEDIKRLTVGGLINAQLPIEIGGLGLEPVDGYENLSLRRVTRK